MNALKVLMLSGHLGQDGKDNWDRQKCIFLLNIYIITEKQFHSFLAFRNMGYMLSLTVLKVVSMWLHVCLCEKIKKKLMRFLMNGCITFHCYENCFEGLPLESPLYRWLQRIFQAAAWKGLIWVWRLRWDQKWDCRLVFLGIIWRQGSHFQRNSIYFSLEQMTWLNIYLHNCSQMLDVERSTHKKVIW